jgi:small-conductance mechanosensitive channel
VSFALVAAPEVRLEPVRCLDIPVVFRYSDPTSGHSTHHDEIVQMRREGVATLQDLYQAMSPAIVKSYQVFYFGNALGVLIFFFVVLFLFLQSFSDPSTPTGPEPEHYVMMLTMLHFAVLAVAYLAATFVYRSMLARAYSPEQRLVSPEAVLSSMRLAGIVRLAIMEWAAFFGLVVLVVATQQWVLQHSPEYWVNLISTIVMFGFVFLTFPTRARLEELSRASMSGATG